MTSYRVQSNDVLHLSRNDYPGMILTTDLLTGKNFYSWCRSIKHGLAARNKLEFIDGTLLEPDSSSIDYKQWLKVDYVVFSWIVNSISKELSRGFQHLDTSKSLWDELHRRFCRSNGPKIYKLRRELATYSQGNQSVMMYFHNLQTLWDELHLLVPCHTCTCGAIDLNKHNEESERLMQFLMGLNDSYEAIRNQILILDPLPTVSQAYSMVLQVEDQKEVSSFYPELTDFKQTKGKSRANYFEEDDCGSVRSDSQNQEGNSGLDMNKLIQAEVIKCISSYFKKSDSPAPVNDDAHMINTGAVTDTHLSDEVMGHFAFGIYEEIHTNEWILNSGASTHMCYNPALMQSLTLLDEPHRIFLPDGSNIQLTKEISGKVLFLPTHCIIQNQHHDHVLGIGKLKGKLYVFKSSVHDRICTSTTTADMSLRDVKFFATTYPLHQDSSPLTLPFHSFVDDPSSFDDTCTAPTSDNNKYPPSSSASPYATIAADESSPSLHTSPVVLRRSTRISIMPFYLQDYVCSTLSPSFTSYDPPSSLTPPTFPYDYSNKHNPERVTQDDTATLLYSSGASKGIVSSHRKYGTAGLLSPSMEAKIVEPESAAEAAGGCGEELKIAI
ncbi:hypothetical protein C2S53_010169 [Perilla frutescens var. hirtella]|uniref:Retrotransposon Copia-like N-terminal domain-containing protein n=1 Tax=Perilla frutescens var. hirtella TaxID=608512 RepID=A0AAD4IRC9_PERFH|nr:hypothetical protein C2S53_010169 [Perilla frutescens var. hirtella]